MDLNWLEDFLRLADTRNFTRAANERNVSQPAFSRRIHALEHWVGAPLLDRSTFPVTLTPSGEFFRDAAARAVAVLTETREVICGQAAEEQATISLAALHTLSLTFFPSWLKEMETALGPLHTRIIADNLHDCVQFLTEGVCDLLLCYSHPAIPLILAPNRYLSLTVGSDRLTPVSAPDASGNPLFALPGNPGASLPFLSYGPDSFLRRAVEFVLRQREGQEAHLLSRYQNSMAESLKAMAVHGHGIAWVPRSDVVSELKRGTLVLAGGDAWQLDLGISIVRNIDQSRPRIENLWSLLVERSPHPETML